MAETSVKIAGYGTGSNTPAIVVDNWEGMVHLDTRQIDDEPDRPSMSPDEARALATLLLHAADAEERR